MMHIAEKYHIQLITKTIQEVEVMEDGLLQYETDHDHEGIIEVRIFDNTNNHFPVSKHKFAGGVSDDAAYEFIAQEIDKYEHKL
jgi:hypothetical protein